MSLTAAQSRAAQQAADKLPKACESIRAVLAILQAVQDATPGWKFWKKGPVAVALGVVRGLAALLCPALEIPTSGPVT